jgi:predicted DNA-binding transcriptional regulator AlpA
MEEKRFLRVEAVQDKYAMSKSKIYQYVREGRFPHPVKLGRNSLWSSIALAEFDTKLENGNLK